MATHHHHARRLRVYLVEDSTIIVSLLRDLVAVDPSLEVVGESTNARKAVKEIGTIVPDVAIIDIALEDSSGFDVLKELGKAPRESRPLCIMLSNFASDRYRTEAAKLGADYFFDKSGEILELLKTLTAMAQRDGAPSDSLI